MSAQLSFVSKTECQAYFDWSNSQASGMQLPFANPAMYPRADVNGKWITAFAVLPLSTSGAQILNGDAGIIEAAGGPALRVNAVILPDGAEFPDDT